MQKISTYLYPNRIELLADLAGFTTEYTNVYQRNVKIYNGIDNTIEFDIKNADQKRIDLSILSNIELNIMDAAGNSLPNSPYRVTPTAIKGIATVTIPQDDLTDLTQQYLQYSVTAVKAGADVILYGDTRFGAIGKIELVGNAMPTFRDDRVYNTFTGEIDLYGNVIQHSSAIPTKFYEAVPTESLSFNIDTVGYIGTITLEGTTASTISVESWKNAVPLRTYIISSRVSETTPVSFSWTNVPIEKYNYFRVKWTQYTLSVAGVFNPVPSGKVATITVS
jgi:hypothetical protein